MLVANISSDPGGLINFSGCLVGGTRVHGALLQQEWIMWACIRWQGISYEKCLLCHQQGFLLFFFSVFLWFFLLDQNMEMALGFEDSTSRTLASKRNLIHQEVFVPPVWCVERMILLLLCSSNAAVSSRLLYDSESDYWARKFTHSQEELDVASCKQLIPAKGPLSLAGLFGIVLHFAATIQNCNTPCCSQSWKCGWSSEDDTSWSQINVQGMDLAFGFLTW